MLSSFPIFVDGAGPSPSFWLGLMIVKPMSLLAGFFSLARAVYAPAGGQ